MYMYVCMYVRTYVCMYVCMCIYIYIYGLRLDLNFGTYRNIRINRRCIMMHMRGRRKDAISGNWTPHSGELLEEVSSTYPKTINILWSVAVGNTTELSKMPFTILPA